MYVEPKFREMPLEAITLLGEGKVIDAIKVVRETHGLSLKEAKQRVDAYIAGQPLLQAQLEASQRITRRRWFAWFVVIDLLIVAAVLYWLYTRGSV